jgi:molybdenum cofactor cytidylyltransferase
MAANIRGVLLAAGYSTRFGSNKLLQPLPAGSPDAGVPIALAAARHLIAALPDCVAVVRPRAQRLGKILRDAGCNTVVCKNAAEGMGVSLAAGVRAAADADGWVIALADMPFVRPETIAKIVKAMEQGAQIAAPAIGGKRGHPVGFSRAFFEALSSLSDDAGARELLKQHPDRIVLCEVDDPGVLQDIDQPSDLSAS